MREKGGTVNAKRKRREKGIGEKRKGRTGNSLQAGLEKLGEKWHWRWAEAW